MAHPHTHPTGNSDRASVVLCATLVVVLLLAAPMTAQAEYLLGQAKQAGQVGEKRDGYLALIDQRAPEEIKKMVADTNERRKQRYREVAAKVGWTVEQAALAAAKRLRRQAQAGELLEAEGGGWEKKAAGRKPAREPKGRR